MRMEQARERAGMLWHSIQASTREVGMDDILAALKQAHREALGEAADKVFQIYLNQQDDAAIRMAELIEKLLRKMAASRSPEGEKKGGE